MLVGYLLCGMLVGLVSAVTTCILGQPWWLVFLVYVAGGWVGLGLGIATSTMARGQRQTSLRSA